MPTLSKSHGYRDLPSETGDIAPPAVSASAPLTKTPSLQRRPLQVTWEMTHACEWKSAPVRASARSTRERDPFSTAEAFHLVEDVASLKVPLLALTGGDPLLRPDLFPVIEFAARRSVRTSLTLLSTPLVNAEAIADMKASGLMRVAFWLHGSTAALDDAYWALPDATGARSMSSGRAMRCNSRCRSTPSWRAGTFTISIP